MWGPLPQLENQESDRGETGVKNEAPVNADNLLKFEVDRLNRFGDRGRRKFCSGF